MRGVTASMLMLTVGLAMPGTAGAQQAGDRIDPTLVTREPPLPPEAVAKRPIPVEVDKPLPRQGLGNEPVFVGAVTLSGLQTLRPADFSDVIASSIGQTLSPDQLAVLTTKISERMRARGFAFASAWIGPQRMVAGSLAVSVDEGRIDEVRFEGAAPSAVRRALDPLVSGQAARLDEVERRLLIAGDVAGVRVRSSRYLREGDRGVLVVRVTQERVSLRASLSNQGTKPIGPEQARIQVDLNGLLASDDSLTLSYSTAPAQPRELQFGYARYARRITSSGTEVALSGSISVTHPGAYLASLDLRNRSWYAGASVLQPVLRRRRASFWLGAELGVRNLAQWRNDVRVRRDQIAKASLTLYGNAKLAGGRLRVSTSVSQGLGILDATEPGDPLASRRDADGTFTAVNAWADWTTDLSRKFSLRLALQGQLASQPLLISEETSLGGTTFLRGYDWGERSGDEGAMGVAELRYLIDNPLGLVKRAQLYAYLDGGTVSNLSDGFGGGSLASAGGGMRMDITSKMGATLELAVPLSGPRYDTGDETPKLNFSLVRAF
jgi:hemolysin activation/secretion protein